MVIFKYIKVTYLLSTRFKQRNKNKILGVKTQDDHEGGRNRRFICTYTNTIIGTRAGLNNLYNTSNKGLFRRWIMVMQTYCFSGSSSSFNNALVVCWFICQNQTYL